MTNVLRDLRTMQAIYEKKALSATGRLYGEAADEIERLRAAVRLLGEIANACTFDDLGEVCSMCRCSRRPVSPAERA